MIRLRRGELHDTSFQKGGREDSAGTSQPKTPHTHEINSCDGTLLLSTDTQTSTLQLQRLLCCGINTTGDMQTPLCAKSVLLMAAVCWGHTHTHTAHPHTHRHSGCIAAATHKHARLWCVEGYGYTQRANKQRQTGTHTRSALLLYTAHSGRLCLIM